MKLRFLLVLAAVLLLSSFNSAEAQRAGFQAGIAPVAPSPVQGFVTAPVTGFGVAPMILPPIISTTPTPAHFAFGPFAQPQRAIVVGRVPVRGRGVTVIAPGSIILAPNSIIVTGPAIVPTAVPTFGPTFGVPGAGGYLYHVPATPVIYGPIVVQQPQAVKVAPHESKSKDVRKTPAIGTTRHDVIEEFGNPSVSMVNAKGETLYYSGGLRIFIRNGQVAALPK